VGLCVQLQRERLALFVREYVCPFVYAWIVRVSRNTLLRGAVDKNEVRYLQSLLLTRSRIAYRK
jgi:hypothetical protein